MWSIVLVTVIILSKAHGEISHIIDQKELDIQKYIPDSIDPRCHLFILSKSKEEFDFVSTYRPIVIIDEIRGHFKKDLPFHCGILFIPNLESLHQFLVNRALADNIQMIMLKIMIYTDINDVKGIKAIREIFKEQDLILIDKFTGASKNISRKTCGRNVGCALKGRVYRILYGQREPYFGLRTYQNAGTAEIPIVRVNRTNSIFLNFTGYEAKVLNLLITRYGISFDMVPQQNFSNTRYDMLGKNEVDLAVGHVVANHERLKYGEFSKPILMEKFTFVSRAPPPLSVWEAPLRPFPLLGWTLLCISIFAVGPATWWITKCHRKITKVTGREYTVAGLSGQAGSALLTEPWRNPPDGPGALIVLTWMLACLILQSIYSSNFAAHLSVPATEKPIVTIADVLNSGEPLLASPAAVRLMLNAGSQNPDQKALAQQTVIKETSMESIFNKLDNGHIALYDSITFSFLVNKHGKDSQKYFISPEPFYTISCGWIFAEDDSELAHAINTVLSRLTDAGLLERWRHDLVEDIGKFQRKAAQQTLATAWESRELALSLYHLEGAFALLFIGYCASLAAFIAERFYGNARAVGCSRPSRRKKTPRFSYLR